MRTRNIAVECDIWHCGNMADDPVGPIGRIYTVAEAAEALRMSRSMLMKLIAEFPYYTRNGNRRLFSDADITALWLVKRVKIETPKLSKPASLTEQASVWPLVSTLRPWFRR
jgi:hypothetical protein